MRPTIYTEELGDEICQLITVGYSLAKICKADDKPCPSTIYGWLRTDPKFLKNYEIAKDNQADYFVEQILVIPEEEEDTQRARLKVDVRKWAASKYKPKKYGDRTIHAGDDESPILPDNRSAKNQILATMTEDQLKNALKILETDGS